MDFQILGPLEVGVSGKALHLAGAKQRSILAMLLLNPNQVVSSDALIDALWRDSPPASARNALQVYVSQLRKELQSGRNDTPPRLATRSPGYLIRVEAGELDTLRFEQLVRDGRRCLQEGNAPEAATLLSEALALVSGPPLMDFRFDDFAQAAVEQLDERVMSAREDRFDAELLLGHHSECIGDIEALVVAHPLRERLRELLIVSLYRSGRQAEALETYREVRTLLSDELGIDPGLRLQRLNEQVLRQDPSLQPQVPQDEGEVVAARSGRLPLRLSSFIGRDDVVTHTMKLLGEHRLVTLTGAGGIGKTRTALEVGDHLNSEGWTVTFVELSQLKESAPVEDAVLRSLGVRSRGDEGLEAAARTLRLRPSVILLDNCEHVVDGAKSAVTRLLAEAPELHILSTSRAPLGIEGEVTLQVPPMEVPHGPGDMIESSEAVRLFVDRAAAADPRFTIGHDAQTVIEICGQVGGLPLGIELAAARTRSFSLTEISGLLKKRLNMLTSNPRGGRHSDLVSTIDWSLDLLSENEQRLFRRLGVFDGPISLDAARAVAGAPPVEADSVPGLMAALVDKSLLVSERLQQGTHFRFLAPIRQRSATLLRQDSELDDSVGRLALWVMELAEEAEPMLRGAQQFAWHSRLSDILPDLRNSLNWAIDFGHLDIAARILGATWLFMFLNPDGSGDWRRSAERVADSSAGTPIQSIALAVASCQALLDFDLDAVGRHARGALETCDDGSLAYFVSSLALGTLLREQGSYEAAIEEHRKAEAIAQASDEAWFAARCLYSVALVELYRGNVQEARTEFSQALAAFEDFGDVESATSSLIYLHSIAAEIGDEEELDASLGKIELLTSRGLPATIAASAPLRAEALFRRGDLYGALALALGGLDEATKMADPEVVVDCLEAIATALIRLGRIDVGVSLMAAAELISPLESRWWLPARWNRWREGTLLFARETLGTESFAGAWARGKGTPVESLLLDV